MTQTEVTIGNCRLCEAALNQQSAVLLWDGRLYCRPCLEHVAPGLANYARDNPVLEETRPAEVNDKLKTYWGFTRPFLFSATFGALVHVALTGWNGAGNEWILNALAAVILVPMLLALIMNYFFLKPFRKTKNGLPRVAISKGEVQLYHGDELIHTATLADCSWSDLSKNPHSDPQKDIDHYFLVLIWRRPWWSLRERAVLCGFTAETRARWLQFLMIAEVRDRWARAKKPKQ